jgi:hypothetical protein
VTVVNVVAVPNASTIILSAVVANPVGIHSVYGELDCIGHRVNVCEHNSIFAGSTSNRINPISCAFKALLSNAIRALSTKYCLLFESSCEDSISYVGPTLSSGRSDPIKLGPTLSSTPYQVLSLPQGAKRIVEA